MDPTCPHCGAKLPNTRGAFCPYCREELADPTPQAPTSPAPQPPSGASALPEGMTPAEAEQAAQFWLALFQITPQPYVTRVLIAANLIVFVVMVMTGVSATNPTLEALVRWGALFGPLTLDGQWWRLFTCMFLHIGIIHIAFNMWVLASGGRLVERMFGHVGFLILYVISGLGGSLAALLWSPDVVSAGASGAIFGIFGGMLGVLRKQRGSIPPGAWAALKSSGVSFLVLNLVIGFALPNISVSAHAGGALTGFLFGLVLSQPFTPEGVAARKRQNVLAGVLGAIAIVAGAFLVSAFRPNEAAVYRDLEQFVVVEKRVLDTYEAATARAARGEITEPELAAIVERDVLPEWRATIGRLAAHGNLPGDTGKRLAGLLEYMRLRQEGWELYVQAVRENSAAKGERSREKHRLAEESLKRFKAAQNR
jgi:rhomboid protease GluP